MRIVILALCILMYSAEVYAEIPKNLDVQEIAIADLPVGFISAHDGSGRMFIVEKGGVIKVFENGGILESPFLDISAQVYSSGEQGLLGMAFSPDYNETGYLYVYFSYNDPDITIGPRPMRLARFRVSNDPNIADLNSLNVITDINQNFYDHNGGNIDFGADGYLYIGTGDDLLQNNSQQITNVYGKMLRIDVSTDLIFKSEFENHLDCGTPHNYLVPQDNPYVGITDACESIYLTGLRNPWRWSFDRLSGNLFIGDVGANQAEEVNEVFIHEDAGGNLGWPCQEGNNVYNQKCIDQIDGLINPFFTYERVSGQSQAVVGGYVYRGNEIPELYGTYIFNDTYREEFYFSDWINNQWQTNLWSQQISMIVSFGEDEFGELYLVSINGPIYKLIKN